MVTPLLPGISYARANMTPLPDWAADMVMQYLAQAGLDRVQVNSTMRSPEDQARVMYNNELAGKKLNYGPPGQYVLAAFYEGGTPESIQAEMTRRIREYTARGVVVSYHCEGPPQYTAADLEASSVGGVGSAEYQAFIDVLYAAMKRGELKELMAPTPAGHGLKYDPAIHLVMVQGTVARLETATENLVTGGDAASYEGESDESGVDVPVLSPVSRAVKESTGISLWAWGLLGFGGYLWYRFKKK